MALTMGPLGPGWSTETLYRDHHVWITHWLRNKLGNASDAADLAQDVFIRVLQRKDTLERTALREPKSYLATIANGLVIDHWRRRAIEQAYLDELATQPEPMACSPEHRLAIIQTLCELDAMLDMLSPKAKRAFLLVQVDGLTGKQVAQELGVSDRMVRKYLTQAMYHCLQFELQQMQEQQAQADCSTPST